VWALGVVLYEALTGRKAFEGTSQAKLIGSIMNSEPPSITTVSPLVPPALDRLLRRPSWLVALIKPQFEAGRQHLKKGIVRDPAVQTAVCGDIKAFAISLGWDVAGIIPSPIQGAQGNSEFLLGARRG